MPQRYLVVEGTFDYNFFELLLKKCSIKNITIVHPKSLGGYYGGKGNAINILPDLIKQLDDETADKLALIVDSDFISISKQGFHNTLDEVKEKIAPNGYELLTQSCNFNKGLIFKSSSDLPDIAVWIMPNNSLDGYLETLLFKSLKENEGEYLEEANRLYRSVRIKKYPNHHESKAKLALYMAIQDNPGRNISHIIINDFIDFDSDQMKKFIDWLTNYFQS